MSGKSIRFVCHITASDTAASTTLASAKRATRRLLRNGKTTSTTSAAHAHGENQLRRKQQQIAPRKVPKTRQKMLFEQAASMLTGAVKFLHSRRGMNSIELPHDGVDGLHNIFNERRRINADPHREQHERHHVRAFPIAQVF
jgi:hypothetical protein